jgi:hypothetical protein
VGNFYFRSVYERDNRNCFTGQPSEIIGCLPLGGLHLAKNEKRQFGVGENDLFSKMNFNRTAMNHKSEIKNHYCPVNGLLIIVSCIINAIISGYFTVIKFNLSPLQGLINLFINATNILSLLCCKPSNEANF